MKNNADSPHSNRFVDRISRRAAIGGISAAMATTAAGVWLPRHASAEYAPRRGGNLRVAGHSSSANDTLDPARYSLSTDFIRGYTCYNNLTRLDDQAQPVPDLAESFEPGADPSVWIFHLRKGVEFHNGKTLGPDDVIFSLMRHADESVGSAASGLGSQIKEVRADGPNKVVVDLTGPNADFPIVVATPHFAITPAGTTVFSAGIGTGPFKIKEFTPGVRSISIRNENYFRDGRPYVDSIEFFGISDANARLNALLSGDVHMVSEIAPAALAQVEASDGVEVLETPAPRFSQLIMMVDRAPMDNPDLRLAMKYLIDRERVVKTLMRGYGVLGNDHVIPPISPLYNTDLPQRELDHDRARHHLKKAGMENATLELHVSEAASQSVDMGQMLQREASQIGLTINLRREPSDGYWSNIWMQRGFHAGEWNARPTFGILLDLGWQSGAKWNETQIKDDRLDALITETRVAVDMGRKKEVFDEIQAILYEKGGNLIPAFGSYLDGKSTAVMGMPSAPTGNFGGFNFADSVWLSS